MHVLIFASKIFYGSNYFRFFTIKMSATFLPSHHLYFIVCNWYMYVIFTKFNVMMYDVHGLSRPSGKYLCILEIFNILTWIDLKS